MERRLGLLEVVRDTPDALAFVALAAAIPIALVIAWAFSAPLGRRVQEIAAVANRYTSGSPSRTSLDYGNDELGTVARALDTSVQELGGRLEDLSRDRARMAAIRLTTLCRHDSIAVSATVCCCGLLTRFRKRSTM